MPQPFRFRSTVISGLIGVAGGYDKTQIVPSDMPARLVLATGCAAGGEMMEAT